MSKDLNEQSPLYSLKSPWSLNENVVWLASTIRLLRNVEKFKFPHRLDAERKTQITLLVTKILLECPRLSCPFSLKAENMSPLEKDFLLEQFLVFESFQNAFLGEGFVLDQTGQFVALLNLKEHIELQFTDISGDLEKSWKTLTEVESCIASSLNFAFSPKFGFLTSEPHHSGTGLIVSSYLHIPAIIHTNGLLELLKKERTESILISGLQGSPDDFIGDILVIQNKYTLGENEETILSSVRNSILRLLVQEKGIRGKIQQGSNTHIQDKISRSLGLLKYSYELEAIEAFTAISLVKLGVELNWVKGISVAETNSLFFDLRRAHLISKLSQKIPAEQISQKRAEFLRHTLKDVVLELT